MDPAVEAAQARLDAMRTGRYVAPKLKRRVIKKEEKTETGEKINQHALAKGAPVHL